MADEKKFVGVCGLIEQMIHVSAHTVDGPVNDRMNAITAELFRLQKCLERLRDERGWVDVADVDRFIDGLIAG